MEITEQIKKIAEEATSRVTREVLGQAVLNLLNADGHSFSKRPCQTCQTVSELVGQPFGCVRKAIAAAERIKDRADFLWPFDEGSDLWQVKAGCRHDPGRCCGLVRGR